MAKKNSNDVSARALEAAEALVAYIKFFRSNGTGALMAKYPDDDPMGGYENIIRRTMILAAEIEGFSKGHGAHDSAARVRAAAPDLHEALKTARECIGYCRRAHKDAQSGEGFPVEMIIDAALAKVA